MTKSDDPEDPRFLAATDLIGRTGAVSFQIRYCEEEKPVVWMALAEYERGDRNIWMVGAAMSPLAAVFKLCDDLVDGGTCTHCQRPTGFTPDIDPMPANDLVCWYAYDPELKTFRRGCEGDVS
jgi:hypothetical protein